MKAKPQFISSIAPLAERYDAFLLDLWGVIHDGATLYPGVKNCLEQLRAKQKKIIFLSNAPRRSSVVQKVLAGMGITEDLYDGIVTSGETAYRCLAHPEHAFFTLPGKRYFYIGLEKDRTILGGLDYSAMEHPREADFILLSHSCYDNQPMEELTPLLQEALAKNLPLLCINPDIEVVRLSGGRVYCAGLIAEEYHTMAGKVIYFGKPHGAVYETCVRQLGNMPKTRIMAIGDSLITDIKGADRTGIDSTFITGGIFREKLGTPADEDYKGRCRILFDREGLWPEYVVNAFNW